jgi:P22 coat protein - gene protein 5
MPNNLDAVIPRVLSIGLQTLRETAVMPRLMRTDFGKDAMEKGKSVDVPTSSAMTATDVTPSDVTTAGQDLIPAFVPIQLNNWKEAKFTLNDQEFEQIAEGYIPLQIQEGARALALVLDSTALSLYRDVPGFAGLAGVTPFQNGQTIANPDVRYDLGASRDARKVLNRQLCPMDNRKIVLDVDAEANATAIAQFANAQASADPNVITNGQIGRKQGFDWYMDQVVPRHITGATGTYLVGTAAIAGATTLTVNTGAGVPAYGDVFTIAGQLQPYTLRAGSTTTNFIISPPLRAPVPANSLITFVASHVANLAFNPGAFGLVMRPLDDAVTVGSIVETFIDDKTGIPLRLEISRQNKRTTWSFDILFGCATIRREMACRILG